MCVQDGGHTQRKRGRHLGNDSRVDPWEVVEVPSNFRGEKYRLQHGKFNRFKPV